MIMESKNLVSLANYQDKIPLSNKLLRLLWNIVSFLFFRFFPTNYFRIWRLFILKLFGAKIHSSCTVYASAKVWAPWNLEMDAYSLLGPDVDCYNPDKIIIGAHAVISQKAYLCSASHDISNSKHPLITAPIIIEDQAWIGADTFIGMGVTIKQGAVVGARAAVFKDVEPWTVVGGNPAKFIKMRIINE